MKTFKVGDYTGFWYLNHRGETAFRNVMIMGIDYGENEWYPEPTWFIRCWDLDKNVMRSFAVGNIDMQTPNPQIPPNPIEVEVKPAPDPVKPEEHQIAEPDPDVHQVPEEPED